LYLYSDGVPDAMSPSGERFGEARLKEAISRSKAEPLQEAVDALLAEIVRWSGSERPQDDISIVAAARAENAG
jgi:serine phosphatase RsbU (regulator of sigma subunit)